MLIKSQKHVRMSGRAKRNLIRIAFFVVMSFCYLIVFYNNKGQLILKADIDGQFNFSRVMGLENIWNSPINFKYFHHNASAVNLMYPWATIYPMYLLIKMTGSLIGGYYIYFWLITFATLELTYQCVKRMNQTSLAATFAATIYTFAICRTSDIYMRVDMGEVIAMTFFPIVLLGIYQLFYQKQPHWKTLTAGMALLVYTHLLSLVIAALLVLFFLIISLMHHTFNRKRLVALFKATGMSLLLGIGFLVPMLQVLIGTKINGPTKMNLYACSLVPKQLLNWSLENVANSRDVLSPVYLILIVILILNLKKIKGFWKDTLIGGTVFLFLTTSLFPWDVFQNVIGILQFPWRFMTIVSLLFAVTVAPLVSNYQENHSNKHTFKVLSVLMLGILCAHWGTMTGVNQINGYHVGSTSKFYYQQITHDSNFNGIGDYFPKRSGNDAGYIDAMQICVNQGWTDVRHYIVSPDKMKFEYRSDNSTTAILPVYTFPGEKVKVNGITQKAQAAEANGATQVNVVAGNNKMEITYGYSALARVSWAISLITFVIFNGILIFRRLQNKA